MISDAHGASIGLSLTPETFLAMLGMRAGDIDRNARKDPATMRAIARTIPQFCAALDALADLEDNGVPTEAVVHATQLLFRLSAYGVKFGPAILTRFDELTAEIRHTDDDSDSDMDVDSGMERDEANQDRGSCPFGIDPQTWKGAATRPLMGAMFRLQQKARAV